MCTHDNMEVRQQHSMRQCYNDPKVAIIVHEHHEHIVHLKIYIFRKLMLNFIPSEHRVHL